MKQEEIIHQLKELKQTYGDWTYDIPLPYNIWTNGNLDLPHTRLKRIVQVVSDLVNKPLSACRILDLGCLDGQFSIEFAQQGAKTIGIEIREANIKKANFCKEVLDLNNLEFRLEDARNISLLSHGLFDAIICSGLLYHLKASDSIELVKRMFEMSSKVVIIDTHVALRAKEYFKYDKNKYWGEIYHEHNTNDSPEIKASRLRASWDNADSFWFTRPSLINTLTSVGFSSVYECFTPAHLNFGKPGIESNNRCTFVAVKGTQINLVTSPSANTIEEKFVENSLAYSSNDVSNRTSIFTMLNQGVRKIVRKIEKVAKNQNHPNKTN
jgi:SAM-dependent methyltransferase